MIVNRGVLPNHEPFANAYADDGKMKKTKKRLSRKVKKYILELIQNCSARLKISSLVVDALACESENRLVLQLEG